MSHIEINKHSFEYELTGSGEPVYVLLNGYGMPIDSWNTVRSEIEKLGTVFSYNRLGIGNSAKATSSQDGKSVITDLRALLKQLNLAPPYIIVGHSIGGLYANLYGRLHSDEVCGAVFIDPTHPDYEARMEVFHPPFHVRVFNGFLDVLASLFNRHQYSEMRSFKETVQQINTSGPFPDIPLVVIAGNKKMLFEPEGLRELHINNQKELAAISRKGQLIIAQDSGHLPQTSQPDLVCNVITQLHNDVIDHN